MCMCMCMCMYVASCQVESCARQGAGPGSRGGGGEDGIDHHIICDGNCFTSERGSTVLVIDSPGTKPMSLKTCHLLGLDKEPLSGMAALG